MTTGAGLPQPEVHSLESKFVDVDDARTHYFDGGSGSTVVLLHSGEFGSSAELSWEYSFAALSAAHRVVAPDWLGYGQTAKLHDFENSLERRIRHLVRFLEVVDVQRAHFVGNSMGATLLLRDAASPSPRLPASSIVAISGGGYVPDNEARQALLGYDGTLESMRRVLGALFPSSAWSTDDDYATRRHEESLRPGAWECAAAARFRSPAAPVRSDYGAEDTTPYENIGVPVLLVTGGRDLLKNPGYGRELAPRIPNGELLEIDDAGHCSHIEQPQIVNQALTRFFDAVEAG
jgi:pimeloyl-ACP methyl ester carboxylesterase